MRPLRATSSAKSRIEPKIDIPQIQRHPGLSPPLSLDHIPLTVWVIIPLGFIHWFSIRSGTDGQSWLCPQSYVLASFADSQLDGTADDTALGCSLGLAFFHKVTTVRSKPGPTLMAHETLVMPLSPNCGDYDILHNWLSASQASGSRAFRVALKTPSKTILLYERSPGVKRLSNHQQAHHCIRELGRTSPHSAQKKWPTCHSAPHATTTSPSMGVLQLLHLGLNNSWKSRWQ